MRMICWALTLAIQNPIKYYRGSLTVVCHLFFNYGPRALSAPLSHAVRQMKGWCFMVKDFHGHCSGGKTTPEYRSWQAMRERCLYESHKHYSRYGGRGISVCDSWRESFSAFLSDMGKKPTPKHTLERINNDGNYEPSNCRWATYAEQRANQALRRGKSSAHLGIHFDKDSGKWRAITRANLGRFDTEEEAKRALDSFLDVLKEFRLEWPDGDTSKKPVVTVEEV